MLGTGIHNEKVIFYFSFIIPRYNTGLHVPRGFQWLILPPPSNYDKGFTLVELAIALMVIGLLIGGVLKGQELIENARITRMVKDIKDYDTAVMIFRNTYGALPGDIKQPNRIPNCTDYPCRNKSGTGSNSFKNGTSAIEIRRGNFWRHLGRAGLISGINDAEMDAKLTSPLTPFNGHIYINTISATFYSDGGPTKDHPDITRFFPRDTSLTVNMMYSCRRIGALDHKMDDGNPLQGDVRLFITRNYCVDKNDETRYTTNDDSSDHLLITVHSAQ